MPFVTLTDTGAADFDPDPPRPIRGLLAALGGVEAWEVAEAVAERSLAAAIVAEHERLLAQALSESRSVPAGHLICRSRPGLGQTEPLF